MIAFYIVLKTVLGRSWADLGLILGGLGGQNRAVATAALVFFQKSMCWKKTGVKTCLGTILNRFGSPKGVQDEALGRVSLA